MKKRIFFIIALSLMILGLCQQSVKYLVEKELDLTDVYVSSHRIEPRKRISDEDLTVISLPKRFISDNIILEKEDIIGKYNLSDHYIFKNSFFYKESLEDLSEMKDYPLYSLTDNQVLYELEVADIECPRFIIDKNQHADIYITIKDNKNVISDLIIENVEIIAAYDSKGLNINSKDASSIYSLIIALDNNLINTLNIAKNKGVISLYLKSDTYTNKKESALKKDSSVLNYLNLVE